MQIKSIVDGRKSGCPNRSPGAPPGTQLSESAAHPFFQSDHRINREADRQNQQPFIVADRTTVE